MPLTETADNDETLLRPQTPREKRVTTILLIGKLLSGRGEALCRIRNLSSGGLMAEIHAPLEVDDAVQIELKAGNRLAGRVRWTREGRMGVAFDETVEVGSVLASAMVRTTAQGLARAPRFAIDCPAELRHDRGRHAGRLINVSQGGACLMADFEPGPDRLLTLAIPGLPERQGGLRWARDGALGLAFVESLAFDTLGDWLVKRNQGGMKSPAALTTGPVDK